MIKTLVALMILVAGNAWAINIDVEPVTVQKRLYIQGMNYIYVVKDGANICYVYADKGISCVKEK